MKRFVLILLAPFLLWATPTVNIPDSARVRELADSLQQSAVDTAKATSNSLLEAVKSVVQGAVQTGKSPAAEKLNQSQSTSSGNRNQTPVSSPPTRDSAVQPEDVRNPFSAPARVSDKKSTAPTNAIVFGISGENDNVNWENIPQILVTGVMSVRGKQVACAYVEGIGNTIIQAGDRVIIPGSGSEKKADWFLVKWISHNSMTIELNDGSIVQGRLF